MTTCTAPNCSRPTRVKGLCPAHYRQQLRGNPLRAPRTARGEGARLTVRVPRELLARTEEAARLAGEDLSEWWRRAALARLYVRRVKTN